MVYDNITMGRFISRPNRFIALVESDGKELMCHVKNTGRCAELFVPGAEVSLTHSKNAGRKTEYDLVAVYRDGILINVDSYAPNIAAREWIASGGMGRIPDVLRSEVTIGNSRYDLFCQYADERHLIEVKGVTLFRDGAALFPDAPTERGVKHINGLIAHSGEYETMLLFVLQFAGAEYFAPNMAADPLFAQTLHRAADRGVKVRAVSCNVTPESMSLYKQVEIRL